MHRPVSANRMPRRLRCEHLSLIPRCTFHNRRITSRAPAIDEERSSIVVHERAKHSPYQIGYAHASGTYPCQLIQPADTHSQPDSGIALLWVINHLHYNVYNEKLKINSDVSAWVRHFSKILSFTSETGTQPTKEE